MQPSANDEKAGLLFAVESQVTYSDHIGFSKKGKFRSGLSLAASA